MTQIGSPKPALCQAGWYERSFSHMCICAYAYVPYVPYVPYVHPGALACSWPGVGNDFLVLLVCSRGALFTCQGLHVGWCW